jgi:hypothetical protein
MSSPMNYLTRGRAISSQTALGSISGLTKVGRPTLKDVFKQKSMARRIEISLLS